MRLTLVRCLWDCRRPNPCLVLGAWCLVLGAWCLVLGAWCLVLGAVDREPDRFGARCRTARLRIDESRLGVILCPRATTQGR
ncbi:hypothetical protein E3O65_04375 [Cryobacterium breve]|uniref:DUF2550 family protein n=1 Tax=Cryobacterium breve TaxID=1259258 RepID=A0ABY2J6A7_9MICO|nr:hypothetical protein E3T20_06290 [Cryobacterium sp. TmT3-12]TFD00341.1 hypothetical protein E3O65_04375 [Cryobacterium breve]